MKLTPNRQSKKSAVILALIAIILVAAVTTYAFMRMEPKKTTVTKGTVTTPAQADSSLPQSQRDAPSDSSKNVVNDNNGSTPPTTKSNNVGVSITDAHQYGSQVEVRAYANALENGTCTYTFTQGTSIITKSAPATANASTTSCTTLDTPVSQFSSGTWSVKVQYVSQSSNYSGTSAAQSFSVQ